MDDLNILMRAGAILSAFTFFSILERMRPALPLSRFGERAWPNLGLTFLTLILFSLMNYLFADALFRWLGAGPQLARFAAEPVWLAALVGVVALDALSYAAHWLMHHVAFLWRVHRVHHSDPGVDTTTALRQHPMESLFRFVLISFTAWLLGLTPFAVALYSAINGIYAMFEHANILIHPTLDRIVRLVFCTPGMHRNHHAPERRFTDSNYGNIFSVWDRLFGTFTEPRTGGVLEFGLEDRRRRNLRQLLSWPFRDDRDAEHSMAGPGNSSALQKRAELSG